MARRSLSRLCLVLLTLLARTAGASAAAWPTSLTLESASCDGAWLDADELARAIRSELEADGVAISPPDGPRPSEGHLSVSVACDTARAAQLTLRANARGNQLEQSVPLADTEPSSRARVLALAISELVRSAWPSLSVAEPPRSGAAFPDLAAAPAAPPATATPAPRTAPPALSSAPPAARGAAPPRGASALVHVALAAKTRWFVDYSSLSLGGDLGADLGSLRLRAEVLLGSQRAAVGSATVGSAALTVGYRVLELHVGALSIAGYPVAAAGATWLQGEAHTNHVRVEPVSGFYGDLRFLLEAKLAAPKLTPSLALEVGRATGYVARAGDETLGASGGFFLGAGAGLRY